MYGVARLVGKAGGKEDHIMSAEQNKALVRREQEELWNHTGNLDAAHELFASELAEAARQEAGDFRRGFPDVVSTIEYLIAEGNKVVARWSARATHQGEYVGFPPTGKEVEFTGMYVYRIEGERIAESWTVEDELGLMRQIGAVPEPGQSEEASPT
jgi:predicted ester cyclase